MGRNFMKALAIGLIASLALSLIDVFQGEGFNLTEFIIYALMITVLDVFLTISRKKMQDVADEQIKNMKNQTKKKK